MLTTDQCKKIIFNLGLKFGVSPRLISENLLNSDDKRAMLNGDIPLGSLETHVAVWKDNGMPDYVNRE